MADVYANEPPHWISFKGISASVVMACMRMSQARLTGDQLRLAAFFAHTVPSVVNAKCEELRNQLVAIDKDHLHSLGRELRRSTLITAIGILDFCLFEVLVFMISINPKLLESFPKDLRKRQPDEDLLAFAKRALRLTGIERRLALVEELLGVSVSEGLKIELKPLLETRHAITHHSKFYESASFGERSVTVMEARPFPEVSADEATLAVMVITEVADSVLVGVAKNFFQLELGDLRPLNPAVAAFNKSMRQNIQANRERDPHIEVVENPKWDVLVRDTFVTVIDRTLSLSISVTGIEHIPVSVSCMKPTVHGEKVYVTVDDGERGSDLHAATFPRPTAGR